MNGFWIGLVIAGPAAAIAPASKQKPIFYFPFYYISNRFLKESFVCRNRIILFRFLL